MPLAHPNAVPPPWETYPAPRVFERLVQPARPGMSDTRTATGFAGLPVRSVPWSWSALPKLRADDAVYLTNVDVAAKGASWARLIELAERGGVFISLGALATLVNRERRGTAVLRIRRATDMVPCAEVNDSNFITRGFALDDILPYGWFDQAKRTYIQRCLVQSPALERFCKREGLSTVLSTDAATRRASDHPLCLYRQGRKGFLLVIDTEPPSSWPTAQAVSPYVRRFVAQALGHQEPFRGQYTVTPRSHQEFEQTMAGLSERLALIRWVPMHSTRSEPPIGWVDVRKPNDRMFTPAASVRTIGIRTGFAADEWDLVSGVLTALKQFFRPPPHSRTDLAALLSRNTIQWTPVVSRRAVPPPAPDDEYTYLMGVPTAYRRACAKRVPAAPDVRIDVHRAHSDAIEIRATASPAEVGRVRKACAALAKSFGVAIVIDAAKRNGKSGTAEYWELAFPVEHDSHAYDAIAATDRVVRVLERVLLTVMG